MRIVSTLLLCLVGSPAFAAQCDHWIAKMEEDEGGPRMMASICTQASSSEPEAEHALFVHCATKESLSIRYMPFTDESYPPGGDEEYKTSMELAFDHDKFKLDAHYEGMDGAMVMETDTKTPFVDLLMSQQKFSLADINSDKVPVTAFPLKGAKKALETLIKTCE